MNCLARGVFVDEGFCKRDRAEDPRMQQLIIKFNDRVLPRCFIIIAYIERRLGIRTLLGFTECCAQLPAMEAFHPSGGLLGFFSSRDRRAEVEDRRSWFGPIVEIRAAHVSSGTSIAECRARATAKRDLRTASSFLRENPEPDLIPTEPYQPTRCLR